MNICEIIIYEMILFVAEVVIDMQPVDVPHKLELVCNAVAAI